MAQLIWLAALGVTIWLMKSRKSKVPDGQVANDPLTTEEKIIVWLACLLSPVLAGAIFYYGWKKKLPVKAGKANTISLLAFALELILGIVFFSRGGA